MRAMATAGFAVGFLDAADLLTVRMYESAAEAWRGWGRSLSLPGRRARAAAARPARRRRPRPGRSRWCGCSPAAADALDVALLAVRVGTLVGTARAYDAAAPPTGCRRPPTSPPSPRSSQLARRRRIAGAAAGRSPRRHPEAQADERHERAGGGRAPRAVDDELDDRVGDEADLDAARRGSGHPPGDARRRRSHARPSPGRSRRRRRRTWRRCGRRGTGRTAARRGRPSPPRRRRAAATTRRAGRPAARSPPRPRPWRCRRRAPDSAARRPSASRAFHQPGLRSPTARRSTSPLTRSAVGIEPSR